MSFHFPSKSGWSMHTSRMMRPVYGSIYAGKRGFMHAFTRRLATRILDHAWRSVKLHVNYDCNLYCKNCYSRTKGEPLQKDEIYSFLDQLKGRHLRLDILGGEPLLRGDIFKLIAYAKHTVKIPKIFLYTNGTPVTFRIAQKLREAGVDTAIIPFHSDIAAVHEKITLCRGSWQRAAEGVVFFRQANIRTYGLVVLHSYNIDRVEKVESFINGLGAGVLYLPYIQQYENDELSVNDKAKYQKALRWAIKRTYIYSKKLSLSLRCGSKNCMAFTHTISIGPDGKVTPCPFIDLELGNIRQERFYTILHKALLNERLIEFLSIPGKCRRCSIGKICGGGCKASRYTLYKDTASRDPHCAGPYKRKIRREQLSDCIPYLF